jgi:hypothetical protein
MHTFLIPPFKRLCLVHTIVLSIMILPQGISNHLCFLSCRFVSTLHLYAIYENYYLLDCNKLSQEYSTSTNSKMKSVHSPETSEVFYRSTRIYISGVFIVTTTRTSNPKYKFSNLGMILCSYPTIIKGSSSSELDMKCT